MDNDPEVRCADCNWEGEAYELDDGACPVCGSEDGPEDYVRDEEEQR